MGLHFEAKDQLIEESIFGTYRLRVPQFQRPYSWEEDHCSDLWSDLIDGESFFIGQVIFNFEFYKTEKFIDIVDGQQRITTLLILCAVLRDKANGLGYADDADVIQTNVMIAKKAFKATQFKIKVSPTLAPFFEKYIQGGENTITAEMSSSNEEEMLVIKNYNYLASRLEKHLEGQSPSNQAQAIRNLFESINEGQVIVTKIFDETDAYEIFESVNATGIELNVADLLKNLLFKKIKQEGGSTAEISTKWDEIVSNVNEANLDLTKFIRYFWLSKFSFVTEAKLFRAIKSRSFPSWREFLQELHDNSKLILELRTPLDADYAGVDKIEKLRSALLGIRVMDITQCYVLLLALYRNREKIPTNWLNTFELIEKFNFLYHTAAKLPANKVEHVYQEASYQIEKILADESDSNAVRVGIETIFNNLKRKLQALIPSEEVFIAGFSQISYRKKDLCRYVLTKMEDSLGARTGEYVLNHPLITLEHILPQRPGKDWGLTQSEIKPYVHNIGNLTLLGKKPNGTIQNKSISEKIKLLRGATEIKMTISLLAEIEKDGIWNQHRIETRAREMGMQAYEQVWKIN